MTMQFDRPVGTPADLDELEYVSALMQTCMPSLRQDASIDATDIANMLASRHGILVDDMDLIRNGILIELAGELYDEEPTQSRMDLVQVLAILLIPHFLKTRSDTQQDLEKVLGVLVSFQDGDTPPTLSRDFLKQVFNFHLEPFVSDKVIDEMIEAAGGEGTTLDATSLLKALTLDVTRYNIEWTDRLSTHYQDVFSSFNEGVADVPDGDDDEENPSKPERNPQEEINLGDHPTLDEEGVMAALKDRFRRNKAVDLPPVRRIWTAPSIDNTADTYRSQSFAALVWVSMILVYLAYFYDFDFKKWGQVDCSSMNEFACKIVNGITSWLVVFIELSVFGTTYIFFGSAGNALYEKKSVAVCRLLFGMTIITFATILSAVYVVVTAVFSTEKQENFLAAYIGAAFIGSLLLILQLFSLTGEFISLDWLKKYSWLEAILTPMQRMERHTKRAARNKISLMVENALLYHVPLMSAGGSALNSKRSGMNENAALLNFQMTGVKTENSGGIVWAWKRVFNGSIFVDEGVWLHSRLVSSTITQLFVCVFLVVFWAIVLLEVVQRSSTEEESTTQSDNSTMPPVLEELLNATGYGTTMDTSNTTQPVVYEWEAAVAGTAGLLCGVTACFAIAIVYIPSFISSCLKYRTGVFPSLRDKDFQQYRCAVDLVTSLYGGAFWGCIFTGLIATVLVGGVVFFAVWHETRSAVMTIIAQLIGVGVTIGVKQIVLLFLRRKVLAGYYRMFPLFNNFMNVVLECWNVGLMSGIMFMRTAKLLIITVFYVGRLDTPLLADGVGFIGPIALDSYPISFKKDLLQHDAHRHPYCERLATMYMMKLRYGNEFGKRGNSCWRQLYVLCLMPWMRKYRLQPASKDADMVQVDTDLTADDEGSTDANVPQGSASASLGPVQGVATNRKWQSLKNLKSLRSANAPTSRERSLERENLLLRKQIAQLTLQNQHFGDIAAFNSGLFSALNAWQGSETERSLLGREDSEVDELVFFDAKEEETLSRASEQEDEY